jgi:hypothetical protein
MRKYPSLTFPAMQGVKPYRIVIEWDGSENFHFECYYSNTAVDQSACAGKADASGSFPVMKAAMGNVLRKLRNEHISFPLFLVSIAFNHRNLLHEIDELLHMLHRHLDQKQGAGRFSCYVSSKELPE